MKFCTCARARLGDRERWHFKVNIKREKLWFYFTRIGVNWKRTDTELSKNRKLTKPKRQKRKTNLLPRSGTDENQCVSFRMFAGKKPPAVGAVEGFNEERPKRKYADGADRTDDQQRHYSRMRRDVEKLLAETQAFTVSRRHRNGQKTLRVYVYIYIRTWPCIHMYIVP